MGRDRIACGGDFQLQSSDREFDAEHIDNFGHARGQLHRNDHGHFGQCAAIHHGHAGGDELHGIGIAKFPNSNGRERNQLQHHGDASEWI